MMGISRFIPCNFVEPLGVTLGVTDGVTDAETESSY